MKYNHRQFYDISIFLKEFMIRLYYWYFYKWRKKKGDYITQHPFFYACRDFNTKLKSILFRICSKFIFATPLKNDKYYVFALQFTPEASTLIHTPWCVDQNAVAINVAKCIPVNSFLYVKEHPARFGNRNLSFYNSLKRVANIKLISPYASVFKLLKNAQGVITLSGTIGYDAFFFNKPVYSLGDVFYDFFPLVRKIRSYDELVDAINADHSLRIYDYRESLISFLASLRMVSYPSLFACAKLDVAKHVMHSRNIRNFRIYIRKIIGNQFKEKA